VMGAAEYARDGPRRPRLFFSLFQSGIRYSLYKCNPY
jgi:hypothetical protein